VKVRGNDKVLEEPVEVKLDPTINVPVAALQEALDMQIKLQDMQSTINLSLRFLDSLEEQLKNTQTTMKQLQKEPDKDLMKALEGYIKEHDTMEDKLSSRNDGLGLGGRAQIADNVGNLFFWLDTNCGPTEGQRQFFGEIQPEYRARLEEVNKFLRDTLPSWNEKLRAWNAPTLTTRQPF